MSKTPEKNGVEVPAWPKPRRWLAANPFLTPKVAYALRVAGLVMWASAAPSKGWSQAVIQTQALSEFGTVVSTSNTELLTSGGQALIGQSQVQSADLGAGYLDTFPLDIQPPRTSLSIGSPQFGFNPVLVSSLTLFGFIAVDDLLTVGDGVGLEVAETRFAIDSGPFLRFSSSFSIPTDDLHTISWFSQDLAGNVELTKSTTVLVDAMPPLAVLLSPSSTQGGLCQVVKGKIPVLGSVNDLHLRDFRLEFAPGADATTGFTLISSGTVAISSGTLGIWDAGTLSGFQTLRLTATDLVDNASVVSVNVFIGDPSLLLTLGGKHGFNKPEGVAVSSQGDIYVADTNNDRLRVFSSTGGFLASFGRKDGGLDLNKPKDVKVDGAGHIFVADTNNNRIVKLSPTGQVLLEIGKPSLGNGAGALSKPHGVVLDDQGRIYVADTNNHRVQIFSPDGTFISGFSLPPIPAETQPEKDEDEPESPDGASPGKPLPDIAASRDRPSGTLPRGRPFGIAVDAARNIYVADGAGNRALKFSSTGALLLSIGSPGQAPGQFSVPHGITITPDGKCLYVSDRNNNRIQRFDFNGNVTLVFGALGEEPQGEHDDAPKRTASIAFNKPVGLALDAAGNLYVADRNNNRIQKFGAPTPTSPVVVSLPKTKREIVSAKGGGKIERDDHVNVDIPPGALKQDLEISIEPARQRPADEEAKKGDRLKAKNLVAISEGVEYGPEGTTFVKPVTITLAYDPASLPSGTKENDLKAHYWNPNTLDWEPMPSSVNKASYTVVALTTHFSLYQVLGPLAGTMGIMPVAGADSSFIFRDLYAFPNPARGASAVTLRLQPGLADSVEVRVYDLSGRKIHSSSNFAQSILDDGNGKGSQYTFDHVWDVSGVGSGVYMYVITARKAGMPDIHKAGKVGIVK